MSTHTTSSKTHTSLTLKGGMFTLTTIHLLDFDLEELSLELDKKINQAPNFFLYAPVILDLKQISQSAEAIDLLTLVKIFKHKKLIPIGVRGANKTYKEAAIQAGLAVFPEEKIIAQKKQPSHDLKIEKTETETQPERLVSQHTTMTRVITQPVRSGQQIYVQGGDLIILGSVSHGAELLADGHIHVYGSMRGRALAGVMGDKDAMIFCKSLEAELVSVAGQYRLSEDLKETCWKQSVCIQLLADRLQIKPV